MPTKPETSPLARLAYLPRHKRAYITINGLFNKFKSIGHQRLAPIKSNISDQHLERSIRSYQVLENP